MNWKMISESEWDEVANSVPICQLPFTSKELEDTWGVKFFEFLEDGLGPMKGAFLEIDGKKMFFSQSQLPSGNPNVIQVDVRSTEQNPNGCIDSLCSMLEIEIDKLPWIVEGLSSPAWGLFRLDDNGNEVEMWRFLNEHSAKAVQQSYEIKGHKQHYTVKHIT